MSENQNENQLPPPYEQSITIGDSRHLAQTLPDESIDLVFCDPPYLKATIEAGVYAWLAETARRVLRPDGFCLAYVGTYWKYQAMLQMGQFLEYFWDYSILFRKGLSAGMHYGRRTMPASTPILAFRKGRAMPYHAVMDVYKGAGADKSYHKWGQDAYAVQYYLSCFSKPGDLVLDPFVGGGTIPSACLQLGRRFIGFEIDPDAADVARRRLMRVQHPLPGVSLELAQPPLDWEVPA